MARNALQNLEVVLREGGNPIEIAPEVRAGAVRSIQRMLDFAEQHNISGALPGR
jgi:quinolinate synthase